MGPAHPTTQPIPVTHVRPVEGEANELLGFQRVLFWLRIVGAVVMVSQAFAYELIDIRLIWLVAGLSVVTAGAGWATVRGDLPLAVLRRRSVLLLVSDLVAVYVMGTAFTPDPQWLAFYFYPLVTLEATLIAGTSAGLAVTALSLVAYGIQLVIHVGFGHTVTQREVIGAITLVGVTGFSIAIFGLLADRGRRDLRILLDLTSALAHQQDEAETIEALDRRLQDAVGGRVRSIALRNREGQVQLVRWRSAEHRHLENRDIQAGLGDLDALGAQFRAGISLSYRVESWSPITSSLGLPEWARAVTLVPIFLEGDWVGVLPVLWPVPKTPSRHELRLLYGLANQVGLAVAQGQLQRVREEASTDALTRLLNRRAIGAELASYRARAERAGAGLAVLFCDLDGFKAVNDLRGHEAGDAVLQAVATAVRGAIRAGDVVGRYGGDELLIVAADAGAEDAVALAQRVRAAVLNAAGGDGVDMTIGIAVHPGDGRTDADLLVAADRAMYRGKLRGPGQVVLASEGDPRDTAAVG